MIEKTDVYVDEPIVREEKGYKLHNEQIINCSNCSKPLISVIIVKLDCPVFIDNKEEVDVVKLVANCPICNSFSYVNKFERVKLYFKSIEPLKLVDTKLLGSGKERKLEIQVK